MHSNMLLCNSYGLKLSGSIPDLLWENPPATYKDGCNLLQLEHPDLVHLRCIEH